MNLPINDDETMSRNRSEYVNQLLERNRQLEIQIKQERINVKVLNDRLDEVEESYAIQEKQLIRAQQIISQSGASLSLQTLLDQIDELKSENQTFNEQNCALKAIVREYQQPAVNQDDESLRVVTKNLEATEAQLKKTEKDLQVQIVENNRLKSLLDIAHKQLQDSEMSVYSRAEAINHELKKELTQCQVALADCRNERDEMINELKRLHEQFESCSDASYTRDCELKLLSLNEQLETMCGLLAHEKEGRLLDHDSNQREITKMKEKQNDYQLRIERIEKELLEKCNEIGEIHQRLAESEELCEEYKKTAASGLALQQQIEEMEKQYKQEKEELEEKLHTVEKRCIELLELKMGQEKDIARLRSENHELVQNEDYYKEHVEEMKKQMILAVRRSELTVQQVYEDQQNALKKEISKFEKKKKELEEEIEELQKEATEEQEKAQKEKECLQAEIERLKEDMKKKEEEYKKKEESMIEEHKKEVQEKEEGLKHAYEKQIQEMKENHMKEIESMKNSHMKQLQDTRKEVQMEGEKKAEESRSSLEMTMVRQKEKALADQTAVFKKELEEEKKEGERKLEELKVTHEKNLAEIHQVFEKESEEYRRVIAELTSSVNKKDECLRSLESEKQQLEVKVENLQETKHSIEDLKACCEAKDKELQVRGTQLEEVKKKAEETEEELKKMKKALALLKTEEGSEETEEVLARVREEEEKEAAIRQELSEAKKQVELLQESEKKLKEELENEKNERKDESKQQQDKITELKKKCVKMKMIIGKLKESKDSKESKESKDSKDSKDSKKKKTLHKTEKVSESSDSDFSNDGWNI